MTSIRNFPQPGGAGILSMNEHGGRPLAAARPSSDCDPGTSWPCLPAGVAKPNSRSSRGGRDSLHHRGKKLARTSATSPRCSTSGDRRGPQGIETDRT